jgi:hypothetical protein
MATSTDGDRSRCPLRRRGAVAGGQKPPATAATYVRPPFSDRLHTRCMSAEPAFSRTLRQIRTDDRMPALPISRGRNCRARREAAQLLTLRGETGPMAAGEVSGSLSVA